jgi:MFS family permease
VTGFAMLFVLRICLGLVVAPSFPCATQTIHRVFPFKDRARATGLLYFGNSLGSAACAPLAVWMDSALGWRGAFLGAGIVGLIWLPIWIAVAFTGGAPATLDEPALHLPRQSGLKTKMGADNRFSIFALVRHPGVLRGGLVVASAAPITTVMLLWGSKYLVHDHHMSQGSVGRFLWLPALLFGLGSVLFGELRARSARSRANARPPRRLVTTAAVLASLMATIPLVHGPLLCVAIASLAMAGAGGLYTLATSDMLAHAPRGTVPAMTGFTTLTQSLVYIVINPIIGKTVQLFGNYDWVMIGAGLWAIPGCIYWLWHASLDHAPPHRTL